MSHILQKTWISLKFGSNEVVHTSVAIPMDYSQHLFCWCLGHSSCWIFCMSHLVLVSNIYESTWPNTSRWAKGPCLWKCMENLELSMPMTLEHVLVRVIKPLGDTGGCNQMCDSENSTFNYWRKYSFLGWSQKKRTAELGDWPNLPSMICESSKPLLEHFHWQEVSSLFLGTSHSNSLIQQR